MQLKRPNGGSNLMDDKESPKDYDFEALKFLSKTHRNLHQERIAKEFKLVITTLTFFVISVGAKCAELLPTDKDVFDYCVWGGFLALAFVAFVYIWQSSKANKLNQKAAEWVEDKIIDVFKEAVIGKNSHPCKARWLFEALIILVGAIISAMAITLG